MNHPAHIRIDENENECIQSVNDHSRQVARYAQSALHSIGLGQTAYLAGLLHDMGKAKASFASYIEKAAHGQNVKRGSEIHTFAGVRFLLEKYHSSDMADFDTAIRELTIELVAYAIGAHHGLFDLMSDGQNGFEHRIKKQGIDYEESLNNFLNECADMSEIETLVDQAISEITTVADIIDQRLARDDDEWLFMHGMTSRLLLSAVIDGDRRDTAEFMSGQKQQRMTVTPEYWNDRLHYLEQKLADFPQTTEIQRARREISDRCSAMAEKSEISGIYRLNVPTGAGKTLSALRFALAVAAKHGKQRIIFTAPLISILDQNAKVINDFFGDQSNVLLHHSNVIMEAEDKDSEECVRRELLMETWNTPLVITTLVQLLNTLFLGKTSSVRRFQALCSSVIIIDEVQTVPIRMLTLFNLAVRYLSEICHSTFVLCSATQPCLESVEHPITLQTMPDVIDLVPYNAELWHPFLRTVLIDDGHIALAEIGIYILEKLSTAYSLLVICNTRAEAERTYHQVIAAGADILCFHLSASMCMAHRRTVLSDIQSALGCGKKVVCVATNVIEAGVDISFGCVVRFISGLDSIIQAAGRCNRHGERKETAPVYIVRLDDESLPASLRDLRDSQAAMDALLADYRRDPRAYKSDLTDKSAVDSYFRRLYHEKREKFMDCCLADGSTLYKLLSDNRSESVAADTTYILNQAFRTAGAEFSVIDDSSVSVIVPYEEGREIISDLLLERAVYDPFWVKDCIDRAKPYTVSVYNYQREKLEKQGGINVIGDDLMLALNDGFYSLETGLTIQKEQTMYLEV